DPVYMQVLGIELGSSELLAIALTYWVILKAHISLFNDGQTSFLGIQTPNSQNNFGHFSSSSLPAACRLDKNVHQFPLRSRNPKDYFHFEKFNGTPVVQIFMSSKLFFSQQKESTGLWLVENPGKETALECNYGSYSSGDMMTFGSNLLLGAMLRSVALQQTGSVLVSMASVTAEACSDDHGLADQTPESVLVSEIHAATRTTLI
ncbi:hypothetical protein STEG23_002637, partial [Scotinomys teguina]